MNRTDAFLIICENKLIDVIYGYCKAAVAAIDYLMELGASSIEVHDTRSNEVVVMTYMEGWLSE